MPSRAALIPGLLLAGAIQASAASEEHEVQQWLDRMALAVNNLNYSGTLVYVRGNHIEAMRIFHRVDGGNVQERLVSLSGPHREVIRDEESVRCIYPDKQSVLVDSRVTEPWFPVIPPEQAANPSARYAFKTGGTERIAGLMAQVIHILPKDGYRYGYRLWLEQNTAMLLKSELLDEHGKPLERMMFTNIDIGGSIPEAELKSVIADDGFVQVEFPKSARVKPGTPASEWQVSQLPEGFMLTGHHHGEDQADQQGMEHLIFSDGLASVSVYVEPVRGSKRVLDGHTRLGPINIYGTHRQGFAITAVGEVPYSTVKQMATSVRSGE